MPPRIAAPDHSLGYFSATGAAGVHGYASWSREHGSQARLLVLTSHGRETGSSVTLWRQPESGRLAARGVASGSRLRMIKVLTRGSQGRSGRRRAEPSGRTLRIPGSITAAIVAALASVLLTALLASRANASQDRSQGSRGRDSMDGWNRCHASVSKRSKTSDGRRLSSWPGRGGFGCRRTGWWQSQERADDKGRRPSGGRDAAALRDHRFSDTLFRLRWVIGSHVQHPDRD
jgi:hypothetical protein